MMFLLTTIILNKGNHNFQLFHSLLSIFYNIPLRILFYSIKFGVYI